MKNSGLAGPRRSALGATAKNLRTYLNDHLAASVTAIKLLSRLQSLNGQEDLPRFAGEMRLEIEQDQGELKKLMQRLRITKSRTRMATAWFAHQLTDLKMRFDDPRDHRLRRLEMLELVEVGLEGKRALWQALSAASHAAPELRGPDYHQLTNRAQNQHDRIETARLVSARNAFANHR